MTSRSATVLVIFIIAIFAFCLASVFAAMTGPISILPQESDSGGILDNLSAITDDIDNTDNSYGYQQYDDYSSNDYSDDSSDDSNIETTTDDSSDDKVQEDDSDNVVTTTDDSSTTDNKDSGSSKDSSNNDNPDK